MQDVYKAEVEMLRNQIKLLKADLDWYRTRFGDLILSQEIWPGTNINVRPPKDPESVCRDGHI